MPASSEKTGTKNSIYCIIKYINENEVLSSEAFIKRIQQVSRLTDQHRIHPSQQYTNGFTGFYSLVTVTGSFRTFT